jgi:predicted secreted hydrolase
LNDQELYDLRSISASYWEGSVSVEGTVRGELIKGKGYVELVGYGKDLIQDLPD